MRYPSVKFLRKLLTYTMLLVFSVSGRSEIIPASSGDGELMLVLYSGVHKNSLVIDLGVTLSAFNIATDQSFDLTSSPFYALFVKEARNDVRFVVVGADSLGPISKAGAKQLFITTTAGSLFPAPTNFDLAQYTSRFDLHQKSLNRNSDWADFQGDHRTKSNGSSLDKSSGTSSSFELLNLGIMTQLGAKMVTAGNPAELIAVKSVDGEPLSRAQVIDFYNDVETKDHHGAFFDLDVTAGRLNYFGAPKVPANPPKPASG
jgi:hypothetical protein